jgi:endonuclease YncB( thermonuclease family)
MYGAEFFPTTMRRTSPARAAERIAAAPPAGGVLDRTGALLAARAAMRLLISAVFFFVSAGAHADRIGHVSQVHDGDSLTFVAKDRQLKIRLVNIDAPELAQPFGKQSRAALVALCADKQARIVEQGKDGYGRTLARVTCAGVDASAEQVRRGHAWVFVRFAPKGSPLYNVQAEAQRRRAGLWADPRPMEPWEWRRAKNKGEVLTSEKL